MWILSYLFLLTIAFDAVEAMSTKSINIVRKVPNNLESRILEPTIRSRLPKFHKHDMSTFVTLITGVGENRGGQVHGGRDILHAQGATRQLDDPHMWTHLFLAAGGTNKFI